MPVARKGRPAVAERIDQILLTVNDLAFLLQISPRQVWRSVSMGELPRPQFIGRRARWLRTKVEEALASRQERAEQNGSPNSEVIDAMRVGREKASKKRKAGEHEQH